MSTTHTPGPWCAEGHNVFKGARPLPLALFIADCSHSGAHRPQAETEANARLIAAAPELLAALIEVVAEADRETTPFIKARAAIAKATGGAA
jgi:hypothetical protein